MVLLYLFRMYISYFLFVYCAELYHEPHQHHEGGGKLVAEAARWLQQLAAQAAGKESQLSCRQSSRHSLESRQKTSNLPRMVGRDECQRGQPGSDCIPIPVERKSDLEAYALLGRLGSHISFWTVRLRSRPASSLYHTATPLCGLVLVKSLQLIAE